LKITNQLQLAKAIKADGNHPIGHGLYMSVRGNSTRWVYRYKVDGKLKELPIGSYPDVTLAKARLEADNHRRVFKVQKLDPAVVARTKHRAILVAAAAPSFREDTMKFFAKTNRKWKSDDYRRDWLSSMERYVFPHIGDRDTATLTTPQIVEVIKPIWGKLAKADVILDRIRQVIEYAMDTDDHGRFTMGNVAQRVRKRLADGVQPLAKHHESLPWAFAPALYSKLATVSERNHGKAMAAKALRFLLLCCCPRTNEILGARWSEMRGDEFHVPAERMKSGIGRVIPLSHAAVTLLEDFNDRRDGLIFRSGRRGKTVNGQFIPFQGGLQPSAMRQILQQLMPRLDGGEPWDVHGLRSSFRMWVSAHAESVRDHDAAELALGHVIGNKVHRAYDRPGLIAERRALSERWAAFLMS
jgi:integrase